MKITRKLLAGAAILGMALTVTACGSTPAANPAACKAAMVKAYAYALANPSGAPAAEPAACKGVPAATVSQYATQIMEGKAG